MALIISSLDFEYCDYPEHFYFGPARTDIYLSPVGCTLDEFLDWFMLTKTGENFCRFSDNGPFSGRITDIGGCGIDLSVGVILSVSYESWLPLYIDSLIASAKSDLNAQYNAALDRLGLSTRT